MKEQPVKSEINKISSKAKNNSKKIPFGALRDIKKFIKKYNLSITSYEENLLQDMLVNLYASSESLKLSEILQNKEKSDKLFKDFYVLLTKKSEIDEISINNLFKLKYKLQAISLEAEKITNTKDFPINTTILHRDENSEIQSFMITENSSRNFKVEIPESLCEFYTSTAKPALLSKFNFTVISQSGYKYFCQTRITKYEEEKETDSNNTKFFMVLSHSKKIDAELQRRYERKELNEACSFSVTKIYSDSEDEIESSSEETANTNIIGTPISGTLINISGGGCCIHSEFQCKEDSELSIKIPFLNCDKIIGTVKKTRKLNENSYALHIQFNDFSIKTQNMILAYVYNY